MTTGKTVGLLTTLWVVAVVALYVWLFTIGLGNWSVHMGSGVVPTQGKQQEAMVTVVLAAVAVGGLGLIGLLAMSRRAFVTGTVYLVLTLIAAAFAVTPVTEAFRG